MQALGVLSPPAHGSVSLVLHSTSDALALERALEDAKDNLLSWTDDYEILVIEGDDASDTDLSPGNSADRPSAVTDAPGNFTRALARGHTASRGAQVIVATAHVNFSALCYLLPMAAQHPIVWGRDAEHASAWSDRLLKTGFNALARFLLGTGVRDCATIAPVVIVQRSILNDLVPKSTGSFGQAEFLARARRSRIPVVEAVVPTTPAPKKESCTSWRSLRAASADCLRFWWSKLQFPGPAKEPIVKPSRLWGVLLALLAALVLFPKLNHPLLDPDEGRQAEIPREMLAHHDLLLPRMAGQPYYEKPPLQYWLTAAVYSLFGVHSWCARMVPAAAAWLTVLLTFAWGQRTLGPRAAFLAAGGLCLTPGFVVLGRTVVLDSLLALCVAASWYAGYLAIHAPKMRWRWWLASAIACGLGLLAKGPIAFVLFAPPVFAYQLLTSTAARPRWRPWLAFIGLALAIASPWYAAIALHDPDYLRQFIWRANVLRFVNPYDHEQPWWFYLPVLFVATLPWSFLWPALASFLGGRSFRLAVLRTSALGYCMLAVGWSFLFLSLAGCKSPPYLAPLFAPLALLLGACIDAILFELQGRRDIYLDYVRQALPWRAVLFVLTVSAGSYVMISLLGWQTWGLAIVQAALSLALMIAWWRYGRHAPPRVAWAVCAVVTLLFVTFTMRDLLSGFASRHSPALIARLVRDLPGADSRTVVSYGRQWNSACFYLRRDVVCLCDQEHRDDLIKFLQKQAKTMVLVESGPPLVDFLAALPPTLGHEVHFPRKEGQAAVVVVRRQK